MLNPSKTKDSLARNQIPTRHLANEIRSSQVERSQVPDHRPVSRGNQGVGAVTCSYCNKWDIYSIVAHLWMID
jgi:hypothetical protein